MRMARNQLTATLCCEPEFERAFDIIEPDALVSPLVFSSPHSGRIYPARFLAATPLDAATLRRSEDAYVDDLFASASSMGAPLLRARFPRAYLDLNRNQRNSTCLTRLPSFANTCAGARGWT
jgi:N-formylglutamate amidohydrolase